MQEIVLVVSIKSFVWMKKQGKVSIDVYKIEVKYTNRKNDKKATKDDNRCFQTKLLILSFH